MICIYNLEASSRQVKIFWILLFYFMPNLNYFEIQIFALKNIIKRCLKKGYLKALVSSKK